MPNPIKYTIGSETNALKKGNFYLGTGDVEKGPTSSTGYYSGINPPNGGYTVYVNKALDGPSIITPSSDAELIGLTNSIAGQSFTSATECLVYYASQNDKLICNIEYPRIITNGLVLNVDAGFTPSYPTSGVTWYDVSVGNNNGTLINGPTFDSANGGSIVFDGVDDSVSVPINPIFNTPSVTFEVWANLQSRNDRHIVYLNWTGNSLEVNSNRSVSFYNFSTSLRQQGVTTISNVFEFNNWAQFVGMYDNVSQTLQVYVNGVLLATRLNIPSTSYGVSVHSISPSFGRVLGRVSVVRHYNRALTAQEVLQNYNATKSRYGL
jgi:hypothetical protein